MNSYTSVRRIATTLLSIGIALTSFSQEVKPLISGLTDKDVAVRQDAAEQLGKRGAIAHEAIPALVTALKDPEVRVRANAAWALGKIQQKPETSIPALIETFQDEDWTVCHNAALSATWYGATAAPLLEQALTDRRERVRLYAASALHRIDRSHDKKVVPTLDNLLSSGDAQTRFIAAQTIVTIGAPAAVTVPKLIALLKDKNPLIHLNAISALGAIGDAARPAVAELATLVLAPNKNDVRIAAITSLGQIGQDPELWMPNATKMLGPSTSESIPAAAIRALVKMGARSVPFLITALGDPDEGTREFAAEAAGLIGPPAAPAAPRLVALLSDPRWETRRRAAEALGMIGVSDEKVLAAMRKAGSDANEQARAAAQTALAALTTRKPGQ